MSRNSVETIEMEDVPARKDGEGPAKKDGDVPKNGQAGSPKKAKQEKKKDKKKKKNGRKSSKDVIIDSPDGLTLKEIKERLPCTHSRCCKIFIILVLLALDTADLISDWLLCVDVSIVEVGLVYGPPERSEIIALYVFSVLGTLTFIFEVVNIGRELFNKTPWVDVDLISAITIWIEDVPQIVINVFIALCREDPVSIFQLTKATIIIFGILIRIIISFVRYTNKKALIELKMHTAETIRHVTYRVLIILGLLVNFACAIAVFVFTQTQRDPNGSLHFQVPKTVFEDRYNDERYFHNVSVYLHHPSFEMAGFHPSDVNQVTWMRLISINSIRDLPDKKVLFKYEYQEVSPGEVKMTLWNNDNDSGAWVAKECYTVHNTTTVIDGSTAGGGSCDSFLSGPRNSLVLQFSFKPPDKFFRRLIFGDINYYAMLNDTNGACSGVNDIAETLPEGVPSNHKPVIHYYRTNASAAHAQHLLRSGASPRFYRTSDLVDITIVWKTGWRSCETTGSLAPHLDKSITDTPCQ